MREHLGIFNMRSPVPTGSASMNNTAPGRRFPPYLRRGRFLS